MKETARAALAATFAVALLAWPVSTPAQDYPNRPVRIVVGFPAGTSADITARVVGARMSQILGQQFVVENKPGAGSKLAAEQVARAPKDGYTLLMCTVAQTINPAMNRLRFDFTSATNIPATMTIDVKNFGIGSAFWGVVAGGVALFVQQWRAKKGN